MSPLSMENSQDRMQFPVCGQRGVLLRSERVVDVSVMTGEIRNNILESRMGINRCACFVFLTRH